MKRSKRIVIFELGLVILLSLGAFMALLRPGYFSMHDDVQIMRLYEMEKCMRDGQIPCRWAPDMGAGYGYPLYNFYPPLPYYVGALLRLFSMNFVSIVKALFILSFIFSGIFMYLLASELFGKRGGMVAALFFVYAPYHAVDVFVRGALAEAWGIMFFPLILLTLYKFVQREKAVFFGLSILSLFSLFISHNIMTLIFLPFALAWVLFWIALTKKWRILWKVVCVFLWAGALAAFFLLPAFYERSLVRIETLTSGYYNFRNHFATIRQLFIDRTWDYGSSSPGPNDSMSFQLGFPHWLLAFASGLLAVRDFFRQKNEKNMVSSVIFVLFLVAVFMTHAKSILIWNNIPILAFVQFPWRFLALAMTTASLLAGGFVARLNNKFQTACAAILIFGVTFLNIGYFRPERHYPSRTDRELLSGDQWTRQQMASIRDYLPTRVKKIPNEIAPSKPWSVKGEAKVAGFKKQSNFWRFDVDVSSTESAKVKVPIFDFPAWEVVIDNRIADHAGDNLQGVIEIEIPSGKHTVFGWFRNTPLRTAADFATLLAFVALVLFLIYQDRRNEQTWV